MTKKELMQLYYLNREIMNDTEELVELKIKQRSGKPWNEDSEKLIKERERELVSKIRNCTQLKEKIDKFINNIDDSLTRQIFYYRYVKCMPWRQVSYMTGAYCSEDCVRKIAERYLKKCDKN